MPSLLSRILVLLPLMALFGACSAQVIAPPVAAHSNITPKPPVPTGAQLTGGMGVSFLRLEQHETPPAPCDAAIYGSITAAAGVGLCACQPQPDGKHGDWVLVNSGQACWPQREK